MYVDYIKHERVKIQRFLGSLPLNYRDMIEFVNRPILNEAIRMEIHCYEKGKGKSEIQPTWQGKLRGKFE